MSNCNTLSATTDWNRISYPRLCALVAAAPSRLSQAMHNAAFRAVEAPFCYVAFATQRTEVAIESMRELGIRGFSLTIPHKERAMSLVDAISPEVQAIGAINTVVNTGTALLGYNTDYIGVQRALEEVSWEPASTRALVFGAGGAARAAIYALKDSGCSAITVSNRTYKRAQDLAAQFSVESIEIEKLRSLSADEFTLFINTTSIGMPIANGKPSDSEYPFDLGLFTRDHIVFDMVCANTPLLRSAAQAGSTCVAGIRMLLHQAVEQNRLFAEHEPSVTAMESALGQEYSEC